MKKCPIISSYKMRNCLQNYNSNNNNDKKFFADENLADSLQDYLNELTHFVVF